MSVFLLVNCTPVLNSCTDIRASRTKKCRILLDRHNIKWHKFMESVLNGKKGMLSSHVSHFRLQAPRPLDNCAVTVLTYYYPFSEVLVQQTVYLVTGKLGKLYRDYIYSPLAIVGYTHM